MFNLAEQSLFKTLYLIRAGPVSNNKCNNTFLQSFLSKLSLKA